MTALTVGTSRCRCAACGRSFGGVGGFDAHQRLTAGGGLRCLDPATVGLVISPDGWWARQAPVLHNGVGRHAATGGDDGRLAAPPTRGA